ncbi:hypothetical protein GCM10008959_30050 [Deinococcus seoulensis]|uniref:Uncharacterized protein n=1 Tax=Deinococcus seoulensis TaxID=1837379 RepID=A0ABQ2RXY9_9DEIO|nr:hypothetical protein [Deinococcus seoulensis]GGR65715.1 hypothetical protein GCM10008959_30050 [Deinococcus seoulensis]
MRSLVLADTLTLGSAYAQSIPGMLPASPAQQQAIARNAKAFTGKTCATYGYTLQEVPSNVTEAKRRQATEYAVNYVLETYNRLGFTPTKLRRAPDGGGEIYLAQDHSYMQIVNVNASGKRYTATFGCVLK